MKPSQNILKTVEKALRDSSAYRSFVKRTLGSIPKKLSEKTFRLLPHSSKEIFIKKFAHEDLLQRADMGAVLYASSGSSGAPSIWFRDEQVIKEGAEVHRYIFEKIYGIKPGESTLLLITFSMGLWIAGPFTADVGRELRKAGFSITVAAPGIDRKDGLSVFKNVAHLFQHIIIAGYPPFVMDFLRDIRQASIPMHHSVFVLTAGGTFSEEWRDETAKLIGKPGDSARIISLYGSADAGAVAFETPLSIQLRRRAVSESAFAKRLFGENKKSGLYQFLSTAIHIESHENELLLTKYMPIPLVRYNIHDTGKIFSPEELASLDTRRAETLWHKLPAVSISGRTDVAVTFYALNIYPEQITAGIPHTFCTGTYFAYSKKRKGAYSEELVIDVELKSGVRSTTDLSKKIASKISDKLISSSLEYKALYEKIGVAALPKVVLKKHGSVNTEVRRLKKSAVLQISGKKPKVHE